MKNSEYVKPMVGVIHIDTEGIMQTFSKVSYDGGASEYEIYDNYKEESSTITNDPYGGFDQ